MSFKRGALGLIVTLSILTATSVSSAVYAASANISYAYKAAVNVATGNLVSLDNKQASTINLANTTNADRLLGVVVAVSDSRVAVGEGVGSVQVATSGIANTLVSTLNGDIKTGDLVGVSPFNGIGIKDVPGTMAVGVAQASFNSASSGSIRENVTDKSGKKSVISVGYVPVNISVTNTNSGQSSGSGGIQKLAQSITGHPVPTVRIVFSLIIAFGALAILVTLIYAAIYGSIVSVGRNPLAKYSIFRALSRVVTLAMLTAVMAGLLIFLLLS